MSGDHHEVYVEACTSNLGADLDDNGGEQMLHHTNGVFLKVDPLNGAGTATSANVGGTTQVILPASAIANMDANGISNTGGVTAWVAKGTGFGQTGRVMARPTGTGTITLDKAWAVDVDATSVIILGTAATRVAVHNCALVGTTVNGASCGWNLYIQSSDCFFDNISVNGMNFGAQNWVFGSLFEQVVNVNATGGTWSLTYLGQIASNLPATITAAALRTAIGALTTVNGSGNLTVTGGPGGTAPLVIRFTITSTQTSVFTVTNVNLTGGAATVSVTQSYYPESHLFNEFTGVYFKNCIHHFRTLTQINNVDLFGGPVFVDTYRGCSSNGTAGSVILFMAGESKDIQIVDACAFTDAQFGIDSNPQVSGCAGTDRTSSAEHPGIQRRRYQRLPEQ
jgi:hypothetical protein